MKPFKLTKLPYIRIELRLVGLPEVEMFSRVIYKVRKIFISLQTK